LTIVTPPTCPKGVAARTQKVLDTFIEIRMALFQSEQAENVTDSGQEIKAEGLM